MEKMAISTFVIFNQNDDLYLLPTQLRRNLFTGIKISSKHSLQMFACLSIDTAISEPSRILELKDRLKDWLRNGGLRFSSYLLM
jgi:hypothetical protein